MNADSDHDRKTRAQFPVESLPGQLHRLCAAHPEVSAVIDLAVLGGVIGKSAKLYRTETGQTIYPQLFVVVQAGVGYVPGLPRLLAPLREFQERKLANVSFGRDAEDLRIKESRFRTQQQQFLAEDYFPDESHRQYFDVQLKRINMFRRPLFFVEQPQPGSVRGFFQQSPDQNVFLTWDNPRPFAEFILSEKGRDLIHGAMHGEIVANSGEEDGMVLGRPSISGIGVCDHQTLREIVSSENTFFQGAAPFFVLEWDTIGRKTASPDDVTKSLKWWRGLIDRLLTARFSGVESVYSLSPGADSIVSAAEEVDFQHLWQKFDYPPHAATELCLKIMLLLHLCDKNPGKSVPKATAERARKLTNWVVVEHFRIIGDLKNESNLVKLQADRARMLQKIKEKGPIRQRDLIRSYDDQTLATHMPILDDLIRTGDVVKDPDGRLCAAATDTELDNSAADATAILEPENTDSPDYIPTTIT